jgi:iron complex transport system substrate-binding protein
MPLSVDGKAFIGGMSRKTFNEHVLLILSGVKVMIKNIVYLFIVFLFCSCGDSSSKSKNEIVKPLRSLNLRYAKGFKLDYFKGYKHLYIYNPNDTTKIQSEFILLEKEGKIPKSLVDIPTINIPVQRIVCLSLTQLAYVVELEIVGKLCGVNSSRLLFNNEVKEKIESGKIKLVGRKGNFKPEILMTVNPELIFVSPFKEGGYSNLKDMGMKLVPVYAYNENHPLARAEWLKFVAAFTGVEAKADTLFKEVEEKYNSLKSLCANVSKRPVVFSGDCKSGVWYSVGGQSYLAHYFRDAGADYVWKDNKDTGALRMDYESVYAMAAKADYWRLLNSFKGDFSYDILKDYDERYADFDTFKNKNVVYCNMNKKAFYETSPVKPHIILADYIKAFHPSLLKDYLPRYYEMLK